MATNLWYNKQIICNVGKSSFSEFTFLSLLPSSILSQFLLASSCKTNIKNKKIYKIYSALFSHFLNRRSFSCCFYFYNYLSSFFWWDFVIWNRYFTRQHHPLAKFSYSCLLKIKRSFPATVYLQVFPANSHFYFIYFHRCVKSGNC